MNWRNARDTINCANKLYNNISGDTKIYIVDNNSGDGSVEIFKCALPKCQILTTIENSGYTGGNNLGLEAVFEDGHDAALILNNDIVPSLNHFFPSVVASIISENQSTLIGLPVLDLDGNSIFPRKPGLFFRMLFKSCGIDVETPIISGCAMLVTRNCYNSIGALNKEYFMYCEELEYSIRVAATGGHIICPPELGFVVRDSQEVRRPYVYYYQARNLMQLINQHARFGRNFFNLFSIILSLKQAFLSGKIVNVYFTLRGVVDFFRGKMGRNLSSPS